MNPGPMAQTVEDTLGFGPGERTYFERHRARFADTLSLLPDAADGARLLDVGILPGQLAALARAGGYAVSGITNIDLPERVAARTAALGFDIRRADIECDPFPFDDETFDAVLFCEVLEHLYRNPFYTLNEIFRVLKPGGRLVLTTPNLAHAEKIAALMRGYSYRPKLTHPGSEVFPPIVSYTHFREYTDRELLYLLSHQSRHNYRFHPEALRYSSCWEPSWKEIVKKLPSVVGFCGSAAVRAVAAVHPRWRSCLMVRAERPAAHKIAPEAWRDVVGFGPVEQDAPPADGTRRALDAPFRWLTGNAGFAFENPADRLGCIRMRYGLLAGDEAGPLRITVSLNGQRCLEREIAARRELEAVTIPVPPATASAPRFRLAIESQTWKPGDLGMADERELGILLAWEPLLAFPPTPPPPRHLQTLAHL